MYAISIPILQELYSESHENVCVMFASISGWDDYYDQTGINDSGMECLRLLNEIMWDFDEVGGCDVHLAHTHTHTHVHLHRIPLTSCPSDIGEAKVCLY